MQVPFKVPLSSKIYIFFSLHILKIEVLVTYLAKFQVKTRMGSAIILTLHFKFGLPSLLNSKMTGTEP